jgi:hypothetical protein
MSRGFVFLKEEISRRLLRGHFLEQAKAYHGKEPVPGNSSIVLSGLMLLTAYIPTPAPPLYEWRPEGKATMRVHIRHTFFVNLHSRSNRKFAMQIYSPDQGLVDEMEGTSGTSHLVCKPWHVSRYSALHATVLILVSIA